MLLFLLVYCVFLDSSDERNFWRGYNQNFCKNDLAAAVKFTDLVYTMEILSSVQNSVPLRGMVPVNIEEESTKICIYTVKLDEPLKTSLRYKLFGAPKMTKISEIADKKYSMVTADFKPNADNGSCRPNGSYLLIANDGWVNNLIAHPELIATARCNALGLVPASRKDEVKKLLQQSKQ